MATTADPSLEHLVLSTADKDEMVAAARSAFHPMEVKFTSASQLVRLDLFSAPLDHCGLTWQTLAHDDRIEVRGEPAVDYYMVQIHDRGDSAVSYDGRRIEVLPGRRGAVLSVAESSRWVSSATYDEVALCIPREALERHFRAVLGLEITNPLEFEPELDLADTCGMVVADQIKSIRRVAMQGGATNRLTLVYRSLEQAVMSTLLLNQEHNYRWALARATASADLRAVRLAEEFIEAHCERSISSADIAQASGVSLRSLQRAFRKLRNCTPSQFLRCCRLDLARQRLLAPSRGSSVTDVALLCGFGHLGQFSVEYRKRFGESPSATLARSSR